MYTAFLFARRLAARTLTAFDPPHAVRHRAAFAAAGVPSMHETDDAGRHGPQL